MATTLLFNGCPIGHIKELLGHERLDTTCRYYLAVDIRAAKAAHQTFSEIRLSVKYNITRTSVRTCGAIEPHAGPDLAPAVFSPWSVPVSTTRPGNGTTCGRWGDAHSNT